MFLEKIADHKRRLLEKNKEHYFLCGCRAVPSELKKTFSRALSRPGMSLIAEIKTASPSAGRLTERTPGELARLYADAGADAVSVLTEEKFFGGSVSHIAEARKFYTGPVLMKDFIISELQVFEAACAGAQAVLLIAEMLSGKKLRRLLGVAEKFGLEALVEVHSEDQIEKCIAAGSRIIGVNTRNLKTLEIEPETAFKLIDKIPSELVRVAESGIAESGQLGELAASGYDAVLVGTCIVASHCPAEKIRELKGC